MPALNDTPDILAVYEEYHRRVREYDPYIVYRTDDPEVIVCELTIRGTIEDSGEPYARSFVQIARVRGGKIQHLRDYFDAAAIQTSLGSRAEG